MSAEEIGEPSPAPVSPAGNTPKKTEEYFVLASRAELDRRINVKGESLKIIETLKDGQGNVLVHKYDKLAKTIWGKLRAMPDARSLLFVSDRPMFIVDGINTTFLIPDDIQRFGALYSKWNKDSIAEQFFAEAIKSGTLDAYLNTGVFWYLRGEKGVMDNFTLAKRHFVKALDLLAMSALPPQEISRRKIVCLDAIDEIDYRAAPLLGKIIRFIIRLLTLHFETNVFFVGPAAAAELSEDRLKMVTETVQQKEFEYKKLALRKRMRDILGALPAADSGLVGELEEIEAEFGNPKNAAAMDAAVQRLSEYVTAHPEALGREDEQPPPSAEPQPDLPPLSPETVCYQLASMEEIDKVARKFRLISLGELQDIARRTPAEPAVVALFIRDKFDEVSIMERLLSNPSVPDTVKQLIRVRHFGG